MASTQVDAQVWNYLTAHGLNKNAAAGVMGNLQQESGINPNERGGGIAQWIGGRGQALNQYAADHNEASNTLEAQMGYLMQEIDSGKEGVTAGSLNAAVSPSAAALQFSNKFERPAAWAANNTNRENQANNFYNHFSGGAAKAYGTVKDSNSSKKGTPGSANAFPQGDDIIREIDSSMSLKDFDLTNPFKSIAQDAGAIGLRFIFVIIGLIFIIFALVAVVEKTGVAPKV